MERIHDIQLDETIYFHRLANGLECFFMPKAGFTKTYMTFSSRFGSNDIQFTTADGKSHRVPDGIAHFLEHKMFAKPQGDVFQAFAANGANVNAYTGFDRTTYLFSCSDQLKDNTDLLLDFVQQPYFVETNIVKERGIIEQEILMYRDNPDWRLYFGLLSSLFVEHPMRIDIAGTVESIQAIDEHNLMNCYQTFYHPQNMCLFAVGGFDVDTLLQWIAENQAKKSFAQPFQVVRDYPMEPASVANSWSEIVLPVSQPKCLFGFKQLHAKEDGDSILTRECALQMYLQILLANSSSLYQQLYSEQLITSNFSFSVSALSDFSYSMIGGDTKDPQQLVERIFAASEKLLAQELDEVTFERVKKKLMGTYLRSFNSPSAIAGAYTSYHLRGIDYLSVYRIYQTLDRSTVTELARCHFKREQMAVAVVRSGTA